MMEMVFQQFCLGFYSVTVLRKRSLCDFQRRVTLDLTVAYLYRVSKKNAMEIEQAVVHHKLAVVQLNNSIFT
jgi:hypothetical protein